MSTSTLKRVLAVIPARKGSKGVPGKNKLCFDGKSLVSYAVETARTASRLSHIVVSSDDPEVEAMAGELQVEFHARPPHLAADESPIGSAISDLLTTLESTGKVFEGVVLLQLTSPLRRGSDIDAAIQLLANNPRANSVISVVEMREIHPARMYRVVDGELISLEGAREVARRQDLESVYFRNGAIYVARAPLVRKSRELMLSPSLPYVMPEGSLLNIDSDRDLIIAEPMIRAWFGGH